MLYLDKFDCKTVMIWSYLNTKGALAQCKSFSRCRKKGSEEIFCIIFVKTVKPDLLAQNEKLQIVAAFC